MTREALARWLRHLAARVDSPYTASDIAAFRRAWVEAHTYGVTHREAGRYGNEGGTQTKA